MEPQSWCRPVSVRRTESTDDKLHNQQTRGGKVADRIYTVEVNPKVPGYHYPHIMQAKMALLIIAGVLALPMVGYRDSFWG